MTAQALDWNNPNAYLDERNPKNRVWVDMHTCDIKILREGIVAREANWGVKINTRNWTRAHCIASIKGAGKMAEEILGV